MAEIDDKFAELLGLNTKFFTAYQAWSEGQIMLLAGTIDDPESFNAEGGKTGALGYYPVVNVSGQMIYVPCLARLQAMAAGGVDPQMLETLLATQVAAARAAAAEAVAAGVVVTEIARSRPTGYNARSNVAWSLLDAAKRKLRYIDPAGIGWSNIPERFMRRVDLRGGASMAGNRLTDLPLPASLDEPVRQREVGHVVDMLPAGYTRRTGTVWAVLDAAKRKLRYIDPAGTGWSYIPERFMRRVDLRGGASMAGNRLTDLPLPASPDEPVRQREVGHVADMLPAGFTRRTGVVWAILDAAKRRLRYIDPTGTGWSYIPERFMRTVSFLGGVEFASPLKLAGAIFGGTKVNYLSGYARSGMIWAYLDSAQRVMFGQRRDGSLWAAGKRIATMADLGAVAPSPDYIPPRLLPTPLVITAAGDSLTEGTGGTPWLTQMNALYGGRYTIQNLGIGSQKSLQISQRTGATLTFLTVQGNALPASGGTVAVTAINGAALAGMTTTLVPDYRLLSAAATNTTRSMIGYAGGQRGTLTRTAVGGPPSTAESYTWTAAAGETARPFPPTTLFVPDAFLTLRDRELHFSAGRNNYVNEADVLAAFADVYRMTRPIVKRLVFYAILNGQYPSEYSTFNGQGGWYIIRKINNALRQQYPNHFAIDAKGRDLRERLVASGNPALLLDQIALANDTIPPSLHAVGVRGTLSADITTETTDVALSFVPVVNSFLVIEGEWMAITAVSGTTATVQRGYNSTAPAPHAAGVTVSGEDFVHLNTAGYGVWAAFAKEFRDANF